MFVMLLFFGLTMFTTAEWTSFASGSKGYASTSYSAVCPNGTWINYFEAGIDSGWYGTVSKFNARCSNDEWLLSGGCGEASVDI